MIAYTTVGTNDMARASAFYDALLAELGAGRAMDMGRLIAYAAGEGGALHDSYRAEAEAQGVFGVPSLLIEGELFWGGDRLEMVRERLAQLTDGEAASAG